MATKTNRRPWLAWAGLCVLALWLVSRATMPAPTGRLPRIPVGMPRTRELPYELPPLTDHALEHQDAQQAWNWVQHNGRFCRWQCPDGRTRFACNMRGSDRWAMVVLEGDALITAFITNQGYAVESIAGCTNPWRLSHP